MTPYCSFVKNIDFYKILAFFAKYTINPFIILDNDSASLMLILHLNILSFIESIWSIKKVVKKIVSDEDTHIPNCPSIEFLI